MDFAKTIAGMKLFLFDMDGTLYLGNRLYDFTVELLAEISLLHWEDFNDVMSRLYQEANGYKGDYIHPRFIACLIRLGDLLDFDNNRFNEFSIAFFPFSWMATVFSISFIVIISILFF